MRPTKSSHCFQVKGKEVKFSSNFDSGNLRTVTQIGEFQFLLESSYDSYQMPSSSKSFFHFKVQNYPIQEPIRIIINNLSLLECIKPERRIYYRPCFSFNGHDYQRLPTENSIIKNHGNCLSLQINLTMVKSLIFLSFSIPYSYERYLNMVRDLPDSSKQFYIKKQVLCYSKNLHLVYMITITSFDRRTNNSDQIGCSTNGVILPQKHLDESRAYFDKPVILLSARVHPGQTPSSWAIEGIIKFLISDEQQAKILRKNFQIVIVPMLNPDGVYEGMYRLDTQCHNLNRYYLVSDNRQPSIYSMKHLIKHYNATKRLLFYFDFHGHPSYKGSFLYGNAIDDIAYQSETELFGRIMSIKCDTFQQKYCIFDRQQMSSKDKFDMYTKQGCARVYAFKTANILHSYTVEMGFHGCAAFPENSNKNTQQFHYAQKDYYNQGVSVLKSVLEVSSLVKSNIDKKKLRREIAEQILIRQQRFRKQDKHINMKKKNVNETLQNQYWNPIKLKFFNTFIQVPKSHKAGRKKIISRTSFISSSVIKNIEQKQQQKYAHNSQKAATQKLNTQIYEFNEAETITNKIYLQNKKKRIEIRHMMHANKKYKDSSFARKESIQSKLGEADKMSIQKTIEKPKRNQIKILSGRKLIQQQHYMKPFSENFQQFMFNDLNMRKSIPESINQNDSKNGFCFISAEKISPRVQELRDIFKSEGKKQFQKFKKVGASSYKKYSSFLG